MSLTVCTTDSRNASVASAKSRCASSKKNTSFGFGRSPTSGSCSKSSASSHIRTVEKSFGRSWTAASSRQETTPRPSGAVRIRSAISSCGSPKNSVPPPSSSETRERSNTPIVAADPLQLGLPLGGVEERQERAKVREVDDREPLLVRVTKDEREALLLRLVRVEHLGKEERPEVRDRGADGDAGADRADREVLGRESRGSPVLPGLRGALLCRAALLPGLRDPGEVALDVGADDRDSSRGQLLGEQLERARLSRACRARDQAVAVRGRERKPDDRVLRELAVVHAATEIQSFALERVRLGDLLREVGHRRGNLPGARLHWATGRP